MEPLEPIRRRYAEEVARATSPAVIDAFARVPREAFLGPGPWGLVAPPDLSHPRPTPDASPVHVYRDVAVVIDAGKGLNNGQPSAHARWIAAVAPRPGERVLHLGCGTGYYTAILAELVGPAGAVLALELEPDLAARARANLAPWPQVEVAAEARGAHDVVYVNAGATHLLPAWLDALRPGGRLLAPLTAHVPGLPGGVGFMVRVERATDAWPAVVVSPVGIYDCAGARAPEAEAQVRGMLARPPLGVALAVERAPHARGDACLVHVDGACLGLRRQPEADAV